VKTWFDAIVLIHNNFVEVSNSRLILRRYDFSSGSQTVVPHHSERGMLRGAVRATHVKQLVKLIGERHDKDIS
jgi:hypothetical protein